MGKALMKTTTYSKDLDNLKEEDLYSIILYAIYKCTNEDKYSTISELIYTVDKDSLLNLCSIFGGMTIKIPTIKELKLYTNALLVYSKTLKGYNFNDAFKETGLDSSLKKDVANIYNVLVNIIENYGRSDI